MKTFIIDLLAWFALWFFAAWVLGLTPLGEWTQGAFTAAFTIIIHRALFD